MNLFNETPKSAVLSPCGKYRYHLNRTWDPAKQPVVWIMLNPSTADAELDDPTIRRCISFAKAWGYGGIIVVNLYAYRATDPRELMNNLQQIAPQEAANDVHIREALNNAGIVVAAWGATPVPGILDRIAQVKHLVQSSGNRLMCLNTTKGGHPGHPLYQSSSQPLQTYR